MRRFVFAILFVAVLVVVEAGCGDDDTSGGTMQPAANVVVRERIASLAPAANLGHRGAGQNFPGRALPENSIASYLAAMAQGAHGIELDVELTADGRLVIMHDDTLDRTTTCQGCVSAYTLAEVQSCFLLNGEMQQTTEHPPTLAEVFAALPSNALVNVELKVYDATCRTVMSGPRELARAAVDEILRLGVADRTVFSSFDSDALAAVKEADASLYAGYLYLAHTPALLAQARALKLDAIHPNFEHIAAGAVQDARSAGLQVNVWTVDARGAMVESIKKGATVIITNEPGRLRDVLAAQR